MTAKIRVKDIAKELGVGNKEIMQVLRELGIQAKSQLGALTEEEASQVRVQLRKDQGRTRVVDTEVQPGVIVRRRKTAVAPEPEPEPELPAEPEAVPDETAEPVIEAAPEAEISAEPAEAPKPAPRRDPHTARVVVLETPPAPADEEPETAEAAPADETGTEPETAAGEEPDQTGEPSTADLTETVAEAESETPAEAPSDDTAAPAEISEEDKAAEAARRGRKPRRVETPEPKVRIISMPAPKPPAPPAEPRRAAADSGRPAGPGARPAGPGGRPAVPGVPGAPATTDEAGKKKRKKDRRVVEFTPQTAEEEAARRTGVAAAVKKKKIHDIQDKTGRGGKYKRKRPRDQQPVMPQMPAGTQPLKAAKRKIRMDETIRVGDMARQMGIKAQDLIKILLSLGVMATINQSLDVETATLAAAEFEYEVEKVGFSEDDYLLAKEEDVAGDLKPRPPVVTIMGHVDHGKTSLLDAIRLSNIASGEAGGITQHIGAYHVTTSRGDIVFLDTPGHEAFTAMRARGAQVTDIVVLVVAADDGVMDQTREALSHSRAAGVPIVVAVNKIDKPEANPDRVKRELADLGLVAEDWGGDAIFAHVSAKQKIGLDALLEMILLQAEVLELKANPNKRARGHIVEARLDKGRGPVGSILIQEGTLRQGDAFVCGVFSGRVRALFDDQGRKIKEAGPAMPVEVQGFEGVPEAGDEFVCVEDDKVARRIAESRLAKQRERELGKASKITLETFLAARGEAEAQNLNLVLKADVQGSLEAISEALNKLSTDKVRVGIIHSGAGAITESDILLASASQAIIIGFNVRPTLKIKEIAERENVDIRFYDIIYQLVADVKDAMSGMLAPVFREQYLGQAEVRNTFSVPKIGTVAGCGVLDGKLTRNAGVRLLRDGVVVYTGKLASLRRFKDDVKEVTKGYECGVGLENYNDIKIGDVIEAFESVEEKDTLE